MGWAQNVCRQVKVFGLAVAIYWDYKLVQRKVKKLPEDKRIQLWQSTHERNAKRLLKAIIELEGLWVKLGQYLSTRADVLPDAYIQSLRQLQDSLPPRSLDEVCSTIESELGKPLRQLFKVFEEVPLATASLSQVHRARTVADVDVVVKVQHRSIKTIIMQDLKNAKIIVDWIAWAEPQYDFGPVINEWCSEVPKELDFNLEAENTRRVSDNLRHNDTAQFLWSRVDVLIPEIIQSTEKVLVLEFMDGVRLSDVAALDELGVNKQALVETITRSYAHQIYVDGFFNGDPHPGNFLVSKRPPFKPILLDFGLTKDLSMSMRRGLAKMLLAAAEGDHAALLSAFAEMGLRLRMDMPEDAMDITNYFFRRALPAKESVEKFKFYARESEQRMKRLQDRMRQEDDGKNKKNSYRNPVDAFPGDAIFFMRVLNLLRGLSSMLGAQVIYLDIMRPFAEATLWSEHALGVGYPLSNWIHGSVVLSDVETKLHQLLLQLGEQKKILGIQVCAYKDDRVIVDTAAGFLGKYDPRPVHHDSLFPVFSATKGVTAGLLHWLVDQGKLTLDEKVAKIWPEFSQNGKEMCTVAHVLNHTTGLHNALIDELKEDPFLMCNWDALLEHLAATTPEIPSGSKQVYHALTYGWLCGAIIEKASGKRFQDLLEEVFVHSLGLEGEFYIGIPPGVEDRLASLTLDMEELQTLAEHSQTKIFVPNGTTDSPIRSGMATAGSIIVDTDFGTTDNTVRSDMATGGGIVAHTGFLSLLAALPVLFNMLFIRRAVIPAANGHFSARALARYYAMLAAGGEVPKATSVSEPLLGSHPHIPSFKSKDINKWKRRGWRLSNSKTGDSSLSNLTSFERHSESQYFSHDGSCIPIMIYRKPSIHDAFIGTNIYSELVHEGPFGLGFRRYAGRDFPTEYFAFGHAGIGGSTGLCYPQHKFALAITVNKMSLGEPTARIVKLLCSELNLPCPDDYSQHIALGPDIQLDYKGFTKEMTL